jgi:hypothetical protein
MSSYAGASGAETPEWITDLIDQVFTSDFVHEALRRAALQVIMDGAPPTSSGDTGAQSVTADVTLTVRALPQAPASTDVPTIHDVCREFTLAILGVTLGTYTVCNSEVVETDQPSVTAVRLTLTKPTGDAPAWLALVRDRIATADFVQRAMVGALSDAVLAASPAAATDSPDTSISSASLSLTEQPLVRPSTDTVTTNCHESFLTVAGVQLYHWTVCTTTTDTSPAAPQTVHLEAEHPKH